MPRYVALLRGINVGGNNPIPMPALKTAFEDADFTDVRTYIQSGNVVFSAPSSSQPELTRRIEALLRKAFAHYDASLVLKTHSQMRAIVEKRPKGFGSEPTKFRYDVLFLKPALTPKAVVAAAQPKDGVDHIWAGSGVVYFSRLTSRATQSRLSRLISLPIYRDMTIRNWNTTTKLAELVDVKDR
jgi:uncharacterized protein (DUF1697 family)